MDLWAVEDVLMSFFLHSNHCAFMYLCPRHSSGIPQRPLHTCHSHLRLTTTVVCNNWISAGPTGPDRNWTAKFHRQWTNFLGTVCHLLYGHQSCHRTLSSEQWTRLFSTTQHHCDCFHDSGAGYKFFDLLIYLLTLIYHLSLYNLWLHLNAKLRFLQHSFAISVGRCHHIAAINLKAMWGMVQKTGLLATVSEKCARYFAA